MLTIFFRGLVIVRGRDRGMIVDSEYLDDISELHYYFFLIIMQEIEKHQNSKICLIQLNKQHYTLQMFMPYVITGIIIKQSSFKLKLSEIINRDRYIF